MACSWVGGFERRAADRWADRCDDWHAMAATLMDWQGPFEGGPDMCPVCDGALDDVGLCHRYNRAHLDDETAARLMPSAIGLGLMRERVLSIATRKSNQQEGTEEMSKRYFTNTRAFQDQDLNDLSNERTYEPNEYWIVWPEGSTGQPEAGEEGWRETTEEEFGKFYDDPLAVTHVIAATNVIHSRARCNYCFGRIPLGQEYRFTEKGIDYVWHAHCVQKLKEEAL